MKATIIGSGNLGGAIARGLAGGTFIDAEDITCVDPNPEALDKMRATGLPFVLTSDLRRAIPTADVLILAVKPYHAQSVIESMRDLFDFDRQIFMTVVAGLTFEELDEYMFGGRENREKLAPVHFRIMPNTAISIGQSMTFIASRNANAAQIRLAETMFGEMGKTMVIPESLMPGAMAVGSCGIAYVMRYLRASMNGAVEAGFSAQESRDIVLQTMKGAINLLLDGGQHPEAEIDRVTSPGGYTIRGLNAMEANGFSSAVVAGIRESYKKVK
jgi:pyrroline-5-carboxylate reductase